MSTKSFLIALVAMMLPLLVNAETKAVTVEGVNYVISTNPNIAKITESKNVSGTLVIPGSIVVDGVDYTVTSIGNYAFYGCGDLESVIIPNSITNIGKYAFAAKHKPVDWPEYYDQNLKTVTIGNGIKTIGENAFTGCNKIQSVYITDLNSWLNIQFEEPIYTEHSLNILGNPLYYSEHLYLMNGIEITNLDIEEGVSNINPGAFFGCRSISSVKIPNTVTTIGFSAFEGCSKLEYVSLGNSVSKIGQRAFANCQSLSNVTCLANIVPATESGVFINPETITLHVPEGAVELYKNNNPWASFKSIVTVTGKYNLTYMVDGEIYKSHKIKSGSTIIPETEPVKEGFTFSGWSEIPEEMPAQDVMITGTFTRNPLGKCASPTINIINGELVFGCETGNVEYRYDIKHLDVKVGDGNNIELSNTYRISVYTSKDGYEDSDVTTKDFQFAVGKKGDIDGNGIINAADVVHLTNIIMSGEE